MDEIKNEETSSAFPLNKTKKHPSVYIERDWKEYLGESVLIIFSVLLALILTEVFNHIHEKQQTGEILNAVRNELINNKTKEEEQYSYHRSVLKNIDSALATPALANKFISNGAINLDVIAPDGILKKDLDDIAWQVAKQSNIFSKINLDTYSLLTDIYDNQQRITNSEKEIASVLLSRESRTVADNRITLILLRDSYKGWAVDRAPSLLKKYQLAIDALKKYSE